MYFWTPVSTYESAKIIVKINRDLTQLIAKSRPPCRVYLKITVVTVTITLQQRPDARNRHHHKPAAFGGIQMCTVITMQGGIGHEISVRLSVRLPNA